MATPTWLSGFEHGILSTSGGGVANTITGTVDTNLSVQSTTKRTGTYALRVYPSSAAAHFGRTISTTLLVSRFYVRLASLPTADHVICRVMTASQQLLFGYSYNGGSPRFYMGVNSGTPQYTSAGSVALNTWYRVDFRFDTSTGTSTIDWQIDGVAQTQATRSVALATQTVYNLGVTTAATADFYIDDVMIGYTTGDYPFGDGEIIAIVPNADGSHNAGTNIMEDSSGNDINGTTYTAYDKLDEIPLGGGGDSDRVQQTANGTGNYCEVDFQGVSSLYSSINGVIGLLCYKSASTVANNAATVMRRYDGGTPTDVALYGITGALTDYSESSNFYKNAILAAPGGGWTVTELNNLKMRFGYSGDAAPDPYWLGLMYEIDFKIGRISSAGAIASSEAIGTAKLNGTIKSAGAIASAIAFGTAKINGTIKSAGGIASAEVVPNNASVVALASTNIRNAGAIATAEAIGSAKISGKIHPSGIATAEAFGTAKISGKIHPSGIASAEALGTPKINGTIKPSGISTGEAFGTAKISGEILPSGIASAEALGTPRLRGTISASGIPTGEAIGSAKLNGQIRAGSIASGEQFGTAKISGQIRPSGIATAEQFGTAKISGQIRASGIATGEAVGSPSLRGTIVAQGIASAEAVGSPRLRGTIHPSGIASGEIVPNNAMIAEEGFEGITSAGGIASAEIFGSARLRGTIHEAGDISSAEALGAARLMGIIRAGGIASLASVNAPKINGQIRGAGAIASREALGIADLIGIIRAGGIASAEAFGTAKISGQIRPLGIASLEAIGSHLVLEAGTILVGGIPSGEAIGSHAIVALLHPGVPCESWSSRDRCVDGAGEKSIVIGEKKALLGVKCEPAGVKCGVVGPRAKRCESSADYYSPAPDETGYYDDDRYDEALYG